MQVNIDGINHGDNNRSNYVTIVTPSSTRLQEVQGASGN